MMRCLKKPGFALLFAALFVPVVEADIVETRWFSEENPSYAVCPNRGSSQSVLKGLFCSGKYCDNVKLQCTYDDAISGLGRSWTPFFSEEDGYKSCPPESAITGVRCRGSYCDDISFRCSRFSGPQPVFCDETDWVSEEHGGHKVIPKHSYAVGIRCGGSYCDNKKITYCYKNGYGPNTGWFSEEKNEPTEFWDKDDKHGQGLCPFRLGHPTTLWGLSCSGAYCDNLKIHCAQKRTERVRRRRWTDWFSEERNHWSRGEMICGDDEVVTGIRCRGDYCDDLSLQCSELAFDDSIRQTNCGSTGWFSEENEGFASIPDNALPVGITCRGDYCDDKSILYCVFA